MVDGDFVTPYAPNQRCVLDEAIDEMATMEPPPARTSSRAACLIVYIVPLTLRSTVLRQAALSIWVTGPMVSLPPAHATTPSSRPARSTTSATAAATCPSSVMSAETACTDPLPVISAAAASRRSRLRPRIVTSAPSATSASAMPRPIPLPPPVTRMDRPETEPTVMRAPIESGSRPGN